MIEYEKFLAPWEIGEDDKPLDEPAEIDPEKLKKYLYNLLSDKEKEQEKVQDAETALAQKEEELTTVLREHETDTQRREREDRERQQRYEAMEKREQERAKLEFLENHFKDQGITTTRAKRLAARVVGDDEQAWATAAEELVEDGFRLSETPVPQPEEERTGDDLRIRPERLRRADGTPVRETGDPDKRRLSVKEQVDELIPVKSW